MSFESRFKKPETF
jgi:aldehyde dehydrogenase (NAD+)